MKSCSFFLCKLLTASLQLFSFSDAYTPLSDDFLRNISSGGADFDPKIGALLSPILIPRVPGTAGHSQVQRHLVDYFSTELPKWNLEWQNSTSKTAAGAVVSISNLVFTREPPWTKPGQANFLTLAAHYDSKNMPEGFVGATDSAVPCAILMHIARSIDGYITQMHVEMDALGEGGTVPQDMAVQIVLLDGKEALDALEPALSGSTALAQTWEANINLVGSHYPNSLSQVRMLVLLDVLGAANPWVPSYSLTTHWAYQKIADLEVRMRNISLMETDPPPAFFPEPDGPVRQNDGADDYVPFMNRGVPFLHILPSPLPLNYHTIEDDGDHLDMPTVRDWAKIMTGFVMEWLDMMEVWPE